MSRWHHKLDLHKLTSLAGALNRVLKSSSLFPLPLDQAWITNILIVSGFLHYIKPNPNLAMAKNTMRSVVFKGPGKVVIEYRPIPKLQDTQDIIVKVEKTALCGRYKSIRNRFNI